MSLVIEAQNISKRFYLGERTQRAFFEDVAAQSARAFHRLLHPKEKKKDEIKKYFEELQMAISAVEAEIGINGMFQDEQGTVYKIVVPEGRYVAFDKLSYERTRRTGERAGSLSLKEAQAAGFVVE